MKTPISPALVRAAMKRMASPRGGFSEQELEAWWCDPRLDEEVILAHIRAVAAEMRECASIAKNYGDYREAKALQVFADKLEGVE